MTKLQWRLLVFIGGSLVLAAILSWVIAEILQLFSTALFRNELQNLRTIRLVLYIVVSFVLMMVTIVKTLGLHEKVEAIERNFRISYDDAYDALVTFKLELTKPVSEWDRHWVEKSLAYYRTVGHED